MKNDKYQDLFNQMKENVAYTATDLGVAGATMTAMVRRQLVTKVEGKPAKYIKFIPEDLRGTDKNDQIAAILEGYPAGTYFQVYGQQPRYAVGILSVLNIDGTVRDVYDYMKPVNTRLADSISVQGKKFSLK